jgi:dihydroorotate dehydrogenase (fumarate)
MCSLATTFLGHDLPNPFLNAAGVLCRTSEDLAALSGSFSGAMITKSCTLQPRDGNPEPRYATAEYGSINSMGLPNLGFTFYQEFAVNHRGKKLFISISGMSLDENVEMAKLLLPTAKQTGCIMELNLSCPNVPGKAQVGYDFESMKMYLQRVSEIYDLPFGVKLPPYFDIAHFDLAAAIFNSIPQLVFLTCVNSLGNGLVIDVDSETVVIRPKDGFGGLGGHYILPTALANVNAFFRRCPSKLIVGCGGVYSGGDAFQHILAGASLVQVGTALHEEGPVIFERLQEELCTIMKKKNYSSIESFKGKLKTL